WTLQQQTANGFFKSASFDNRELPFLHTIVYVAEGLLDINQISPTNDIFAALKKWGEALLSLERRDGLLFGRYSQDWRQVTEQRCLVGLAQWAGVAIRLSDLLNEKEFRHKTATTLEFLKSKQINNEGRPIHGALPASLPFWGDYLPFSFINWGQKYFI